MRAVSHANATSSRPVHLKERDAPKQPGREEGARGGEVRYTSDAKPRAVSGRVGGKRIEWHALQAFRSKMPNGPQA